MSANTPDVGREEKPDVKTGYNKSPFQHHGARNNKHCRDNYPKKEKFLGADPKLSGKVFKVKQNRSEQVTNFNLVDVDIICCETKADPTSLNGNEKLELTKKGEERMKATQLIQNSDRNKYGSLIEDFDRAFLSENNNYP